VKNKVINVAIQKNRLQ